MWRQKSPVALAFLIMFLVPRMLCLGPRRPRANDWSRMPWGGSTKWLLFENITPPFDLSLVMHTARRHPGSTFVGGHHEPCQTVCTSMGLMSSVH
ncbi:hypothetical protein NA56DRAFT_339615 [Hyaloscypha hepaticicola]|uniref:Secreted protein n=1 Tax=Hyaloscypha hepaticicola TaxID=2082293 RepID=A0A2J6QIV5_9HELO|nr:hypothetical protein NA56DRAFT_339615 [Hyaloscypha hepaticicola]